MSAKRPGDANADALRVLHAADSAVDDAPGVGDPLAELGRCEAELRENPANHAARYRSAVILHRLGRLDDAIIALRRCVAEAPDNAGYAGDLGLMLATGRKDEEAVQVLRRAATLDPDNSDVWHNLGEVLRHIGEPQDALAAFRRALKINPRRTSTLSSLASLLLADQQPDAAFRCYSAALSNAPGDAALHTKAAQAFADHGRLDEAAKLFRRAAQLDPTDAEPLIGLGYVLEDQGSAAEAVQCYRDAIARSPGQGFAIGRLLELVGVECEAKIVDAAVWALAAPDVPHEAKALVGYGLGKLRAAQADHDAAFDAYRRANEARRLGTGPFDRAKHSSHVDMIIEHFNQASISMPWPGFSQNASPVFVVGMPRSGTTLIEQILSSHAEVGGAGELRGISDIADILDHCGFPDVYLPEPDSQGLSGLIDDAACNYLRMLLSKFPDSRYVIDKAPLNFFHLGIIARMFPAAHIIHCKRDPRDICLSIYFENFAPTQTHATDLSDLGFYFCEYRRLMQHWRRVLPLNMLEIDYSETVGNLEATARGLCDFLNVSWDPACLEFHDSKRAVRTPSRWQVRQPIYRSSLERWRAYSGHIDPLVSELEKGNVL